MPTITDEEFGTIVLRRSAKASHVRIKVAPDGRLRASLPVYAPVFLVKRLIGRSRSELRALLAEYHNTATDFTHGMTIGKSHTLIVQTNTSKGASYERHGLQLVVSLPEGHTLHTPSVARVVREGIAEALRLEAKSYLPKRLRHLAEIHNFNYKKVRFSHASGRWGSCSSSGTISLNIALMKLPFDLIDYVLIHELCHTVEMNHSVSFWNLVEKGDPDYLIHRRRLRRETPSI